MKAADYRRRAAAMGENDDLLGQVLALAATYKVRSAHFRPARTSQGWRTPVSGDGKGWPDLVLVGPLGVLFRELKAARGRVSRDQAEWMLALARVGEDVGVWRPYDLVDGRVEAELAAISQVRRWQP